jgi:hypothetical protein
VLKASIANRTLDNVTVVLVSFKNFRKTLKKEINGNNKASLETDDKFRITTLNSVLGLPNLDLNAKDVERPFTSTSSIGLSDNRPTSNLMNGQLING